MSKLTKIFLGNRGEDSVESESSVEKVKTERPPSRSRARRSIRGKKTSHSPAVGESVSDESSSEHEAIRRARKALIPLIKKTTEGKEPISIGLVLAILNQETGNHKSANVLIEEYKLDKIFGLKKF